MNEAKTLTHMAVSVMIGAMILTAAMGLITLGYNIWSMFSKQDLANRRLRDYSTYAAFDNAVVRGQEVVTLIATTEGDPFVVVFKGNFENTNDVTSKWKINFSNVDCYVCNNTENVTLNYNDNYYEVSTDDSDIQKCFKDLTGTDGIDHGLIPEGTSRSKKNFDATDGNQPTFESLQNDFVVRTAYIDDGDSIQGYAKYHSVLIYDSGSSTDIIGVMLVELQPEKFE